MATVDQVKALIEQADRNHDDMTGLTLESVLSTLGAAAQHEHGVLYPRARWECLVIQAQYGANAGKWTVTYVTNLNSEDGSDAIKTVTAFDDMPTFEQAKSVAPKVEQGYWR